MTNPAINSVAAVSTNTTASTSQTCSQEATVSIGDYEFIVLETRYNPGAITWPSGFTSFLHDTPNLLYGAWRVSSSGSGGGSFAITTGNSVKSVCVAFSVSNATGTPAISSAAGSTSANPKGPALTSGFGAVPTLWLVFGNSQGSGLSVSAYPSGYANGSYGSDTSILFTGLSKQSTASSETPGAFTISTSNPWVAYTMAIQGASAVTTTTSILTGLLGANF